MYQIMLRLIGLYGQEVAALKKADKIKEDLADRLALPEDVLFGAAKLTLSAGRFVLVENHRGILEYGTERIVIGIGRGKIIISGSGLGIAAMNRRQLLVSGRIQTVEWE